MDTQEKTIVEQPHAELAEQAAPVEKKKGKGKVIFLILLAVILLAFIGAEGVQRWRIEQVIDTAKQKLELPYILGAEGPDAYDCSSLVRECFASGWVELPRQAVDIGDADFWRIETIEELQRGDIVCWDTVKDQDLSDHVGVYLGDGRVLHASSGKKKVVIGDMAGYFTEHFSWGLRPIHHLPVELPWLAE